MAWSSPASTAVSGSSSFGGSVQIKQGGAATVLDARISSLIGLDTVHAEKNPLRPTVFIQVLRDLMAAGESDAEVRTIWLQNLAEPLAADLYVQSDKLAKRAVFVLDKPAAPTRVDAMLLTDELGGGRQTRVRYLSRQPREVPAPWLNPMFLARNPALE